MAKEAAAVTKHKYFDDQFDDEDVLYVFRKHPIVMRKGLVFGMASWLIGPLIVFALIYIRPNNPPTLTAFFLSLVASILFGMVILFPYWIAWYFSVYILTNQRLIQITQKGLFHRSFVDMTLNQIQQINYEINGLQETLLGFGTIKMQTYVGDLVIHDVHHPAKTQRKIVTILREQGVTPNTSPVNTNASNDEES